MITKFEDTFFTIKPPRNLRYNTKSVWWYTNYRETSCCWYWKCRNMNISPNFVNMKTWLHTHTHPRIQSAIIRKSRIKYIQSTYSYSNSYLLWLRRRKSHVIFVQQRCKMSIIHSYLPHLDHRKPQAMEHRRRKQLPKSAKELCVKF